MDRRGQPPWELYATIDYDSSLREGDGVTIFGIWFRVKSIDFGSLNAGDKDRQKMKVVFPLTQDRRPPGGSR